MMKLDQLPGFGAETKDNLEPGAGVGFVHPCDSRNRQIFSRRVSWSAAIRRSVVGLALIAPSWVDWIDA